MANLNITEFGPQGRDSANNLAPIVSLPPIATQNVAIGGSSTQSSALNARTGLIRLRTDTSCAVKIATNPTAAATDLQMDANTTEYFAVPLNGSIKIAVISN